MIITKDFVFLHLRKTGGTWTATALKRIAVAEFVSSNIVGKLVSKMLGFFPKVHQPALEDVLLGNLALRYYSNDKQIIHINTKYPRLSKGIWRHLLLWSIKLLRAVAWIFAPDRRKLESTFVLPGHARSAQIPDEYQRAQHLGGIRDPFDWYGSSFHYMLSTERSDAWRVAMFRTYAIFKGCEDFADYLNNRSMQLLNLRYSRYLNHIHHFDMKDKRLWSDDTKQGPSMDSIFFASYKLQSLPPHAEKKYPEVKHFGLFTFYFVWMYCKRPWEVLTLSPREFDDFWTSGAWKEELPNIRFLEQSQLSTQLRDYLKELDYPPSALSVFDKMPQPINTSKNIEISLEKTFNKRDLIERVYKLDKPIFIMFPQYKETYRRLLKAVN